MSLSQSESLSVSHPRRCALRVTGWAQTGDFCEADRCCCQLCFPPFALQDLPGVRSWFGFWPLAGNSQSVYECRVGLPLSILNSSNCSFFGSSTVAAPAWLHRSKDWFMCLTRSYFRGWKTASVSVWCLQRFVPEWSILHTDHRLQARTESTLTCLPGSSKTSEAHRGRSQGSKPG